MKRTPDFGVLGLSRSRVVKAGDTHTSWVAARLVRVDPVVDNLRTPRIKVSVN